MVLFCVAVTTVAGVLRFALGTRVGIVAATIAILVGILRLLFRSTKACAVALWSLSGTLAQGVEDRCLRRSAIKESRHATRVL